MMTSGWVDDGRALWPGERWAATLCARAAAGSSPHGTDAPRRHLLAPFSHRDTNEAAANLPLMLISAGAGVVGAQASDSLSSPDSGAIVSWIRANAIPRRSVRPTDDFSDLQPLKQAFADVRIVGLGEASHGTSEFQQAKLFLTVNVGDWYDGILFVAASTPTHPTPNAQHIVSLHKGF